MEIPAVDVLEVLKKKKVTSIHHANSVITACQFLRSNSLLSRGNADRMNLYQTPQKTDDIDKEHGIWFDVFTDSVDIHNRAQRANAYGPVLFVLDSNLIQTAHVGKVWVTKLNPTKWAGKSHAQRWFTSASDLSANFEKGSFDQMIVFRHCGGALPFGENLQKIVLDDPDIKTLGRIDYYSMAYGALTYAAAEGRMVTKIEKRNCTEECACVANYKNNSNGAREMFFPKAVIPKKLKKT